MTQIIKNIARLINPLDVLKVGFVVVIAILSGGLVSSLGVQGGIAMVGLPILVGFVFYLTGNPLRPVSAAIILSFFISGLSRYLALPWGLGMDILLVLGMLSIVFKKYRKIDWTPLRNDLVIWTALWFGFVMLEILNPESRSMVAWFFAMRGLGFYQLITLVIIFMMVKKPVYLERIIDLCISLSILGALWGIKQKYIGLDFAEDRWLWVDGHHDEHILFGVLRVFSFYSDAGQFGASQAMFSLMCGILMITPKLSMSRRIFYILGFVFTLIGFGISGTRGALAIPAFGGIAFLFMSKNFKLLLIGFLLMGSNFFILKYTHIAHGVEQVRRMRTALADDNPSLNARLRNQKTFGHYLQSRPFGGGVGSAGFWGNRFSPGTLLAETPTDSYYVKVWAETGIVGLSLHMLMLGYFFGKSGAIVWNLKDPILRYRSMALFAGFAGLLVSSYGNQNYSQMPTGIIVPLILSYLFMVGKFEHDQLSNK